MSEVTSSENNSIISENNSFDEIPNSSESPISPTSISASSESEPPKPQQQPIHTNNVRRLSNSNTYNSNSNNNNNNNNNNDYLINSELMSLPVQLSSVSFTPNNVFSSILASDPELSGLLTRKNPKFTPQAPKCAKCNKNVYKAEEVRAANKTFHKFCFKCTECMKILEPNLLTEHQGDFFCKNCYGKKFGPKGYGYGNGAGIMSSSSISPANITTPTATPTGSSNVLKNETTPLYMTQTSSLKSTFTTLPASAPSLKTSTSQSKTNTQTPITPTTTADSSSTSTKSIRTLIRKVLDDPNQDVVISSEDEISNYSSNGVPRESIFKDVLKNEENKVFKFANVSEKCARCQKSVYAAEKVIAASKSFHKMCFTCLACKKSLNSMSCCDNSDGDIFCKGKQNKFQ
jgi:uncharacterized protein with PIN domain